MTWAQAQPTQAVNPRYITTFSCFFSPSISLYGLTTIVMANEDLEVAIEKANVNQVSQDQLSPKDAAKAPPNFLG